MLALPQGISQCLRFGDGCEVKYFQARCAPGKTASTDSRDHRLGILQTGDPGTPPPKKRFLSLPTALPDPTHHLAQEAVSYLEEKHRKQKQGQLPVRGGASPSVALLSPGAGAREEEE